ncbi:MAG: HlyD family efflux transporter periplasmic adaptor subunit [Pelatocladus maniniholoensis HA4357-MV3]|jgi:hemolysin D|uniref:HlyD family efflux transporter periplasmic adaptor subunit n=1 Tax=Pelatocladus maniniholoensis HA4357-MV3 TaxID=1117104 RepID=A0A9E3H9A8_9NOST|nr:HlyD family efflux transporter periplasmic adaptor subunit [Pelatocladus maniniholoensis HA4357-MV3]BAZ68647.1 HlyD family secretion protein [Fischerella sp. NIES-4106]
MANLSNNLPSISANNQTNGRRNYRSAEDHEFEQATFPETEGNDWYYGTEELLDALPKRWTRSSLYFLMSFAVVVLPWTAFSRVDETGNARGRIEPLGKTRKLDSQVGGSVVAVKVKEGDTVRTGQVLVELESDVLRTDLQQAKTKLEGYQNRLVQFELLKNQIVLTNSVQEQQNKSQELEKLSQIYQAQQELGAKESTYNSQKIEKLALVDQARQNIYSTEAIHKLANSRLDQDQKEAERYEKLQNQGVVPQIKVIELDKEAQESQQLQEKAQSDAKQAELRYKEETSRYQTVINQAKAEIQQAKLRLQEQRSSYNSVVEAGKIAVLKNQQQLKDLQSQVAELRSLIAQSRSEILSLNLQLQQRIIRSPINGVIYELPIEKPGAVVQAGQEVAQIAPSNSDYILKAQMPSQESGFLKVGMPVKMKFDAYPFQDYGVVEGQVRWVSPDSKIVETPQGNIEVFDVEVTLDKPYIQAGDKRIILTPGQTATAEVIVRQRRLADFILDPFKKLEKGGLEL